METNGQRFGALIEEGRKVSRDLTRTEADVEKLRVRRVEIIGDLVSAGMNFAQIADVFSISKQRAFSLLNPPGRKET